MLPFRRDRSRIPLYGFHYLVILTVFTVTLQVTFKFECGWHLPLPILRLISTCFLLLSTILATVASIVAPPSALTPPVYCWKSDGVGSIFWLMAFPTVARSHLTELLEPMNRVSNQSLTFVGHWPA
ncbi:hypothetical protein BJX68DRAFT_49166 [Aspergillus pseudodeflectus]|uniref:Uncharacterized protein n=1 Tax=Aspergillus pseudodeflectus TaxID=176178 RepID=A0ABR4KP67_9EURO